jgi:hypothetical protein
MIRGIICAFAGTMMLLIVGAPSASACAGPENESHVTRRTPLKLVPQGTIQLQVNVPLDEEVQRSKRSGRLTVSVLRTVSGDFSAPQITFDFQLHTSCEYFGPAGQGLYIVLLPYRYAEGDPVLNEDGQPEVSALLLPAEGEADFHHYMYPDFKKLAQQLSCMRRARARNSSEGFELCSNAKDPTTLFNTPIQ